MTIELHPFFRSGEDCVLEADCGRLGSGNVGKKFQVFVRLWFMGPGV